MELMEKLLELLNEYTKQSYDDYSFFKYIEPTHSFYISDDGYESYIPEETILSKRFGFIKRLVDNEKINLRKFDYKFDGETPTRYYLGTYIRYPIENETLMTLAIQDEPIEFLISLLR